MFTFEEAIRFDIQKENIKSAQAYEFVNKQSHAPVASFINLACVYWLSLEPGSGAAMDFRHLADTRLYEVLDEGQRLYPNALELEFWRLYIRQIHLGDDLVAPENVLELAQQSNSTIVPYFYLYSYTKNPLYLPQIRALVQIARCQPTCKNRYILSIVERYVRDDPLIDPAI